MADTLRLPLELSINVGSTEKRGSRHSSGDTSQIKGVRDKAKAMRDQADGILAHCDSLGVGDDAEAPKGKTAPAADAPSLKTLSLDKLVSAVSDAVGKINRSSDYGYNSTPYDQWCQVAGIYPDYVIIREGLAHWKVPYDVEDKAIELAARDDWEAVEVSWTPKAGAEEPDDDPSVMDLISETKSAPVFGTVKSMGGGRLGHYAVMWGDKKRLDLYKEYFNPQTSELDVIFRGIGKLPALYQHAMDDALKTTVVGVVDTMRADDIGLWVETQIDLANNYSEAILGLAKAGKLGTSTGTLPGARKVSKSGYIERWPIAEVSLTPTPAEPRMRTEIPVAVIKAAYTELGLPIPDQLADVDTGAEKARRQIELEAETERLLILQLSI